MKYLLLITRKPDLNRRLGREDAGCKSRFYTQISGLTLAVNKVLISQGWLSFPASPLPFGGGGVSVSFAGISGPMNRS